MNAADTVPTVDAQSLLSLLMAEVFRISGVDRLPFLLPFAAVITRKPLIRFCEAFAETDHIIANQGFPAGASWLADRWFVRRIHTQGQDLVPRQGPLVVVSNHPGGFDSVVLSAALGRNDLRIIASNVDFLRHLPNVSRHLIFIADDAATRMTVIRQSIRHLQEGGALLVFPTGLVDPDPGFMHGAEGRLEDWSGSPEIFLRKVSGARLLPVVVQNVLHPPFSRHILAGLHREPWQRQRMAELLQILWQMVFPRRLLLEPAITFGRAYPLAELERQPHHRLRDAIISVERDLLRSVLLKNNS